MRALNDPPLTDEESGYFDPPADCCTRCSEPIEPDDSCGCPCPCEDDDGICARCAAMRAPREVL